MILCIKNKFVSLLSIIFIAFCFFGCSKKKYDDALPKIEFISAIPFGVDSLIITGKVISEGASRVEYVGFASNNNPSFSILKNQLLFNGTTLQFSTAVIGYPDSTYYFKSFATNSFGYTASNVFKYTVPAATPQTAPCTISNNYALDNGINYSLPYVYSGAGYASYGSFGIEADGSGYELIKIYFNRIPKNGIYTTQSDISNFDFDTNPYHVVVTVNDNVVDQGGKVYIAENSGGTTTVSFCSLNYSAFSTNVLVSAKITF